MIHEYLNAFYWGITGAVTMAVTLPLVIWAFSHFTPIDEWAEIKKGNKAVGMILSSLIIGFAIVVGFSVVPSL